MSKMYITYKGSKMTCIAKEHGDKMYFMLFGKTVSLPKKKFLARWKLAERPTA